MKLHRDAPPANLHDLLQSSVAGSQLGHGKGGGDADGRHEDVLLGFPADSQVFVERQGEVTVGLGQLPHPWVGRLWNHLGLWRVVLGGLQIGAAVAATWFERKVLGFGVADVHMLSQHDRGEESQN